MPQSPRNTAITIGNFDGVHLGHVRLVQAARKAAGASGRVVVLCFDRHPSAVLRPGATPPRLSTFAQREVWLKQAGANDVVALHPTPELLRQAPEQFIAGIVKQYAPSFIVEGPDFHFGKDRAGSIQTLREHEGIHGFQTIVIDPVEVALSDQSIVRVSSSMIRWLVQRGRVRDAQKLLGRPYELISEVVSGDKRGRTIGVPTVNLAPTECMLPADGIYAGVAFVHDSQRRVGQAFSAAISVGTKPTFGEHPRVCEAHLIGYDGPLDDYGWTVRLQFHDWLRDQLTYTNVDLLVDQLRRDIERVAKHAGAAQTCNAQPGVAMNTRQSGEAIGTRQ